MANFDLAYRIVHGNEGGYANHPADKGGETYRGIARRYHGSWDGWPLIDAVKQQRTIRYNEIIKDAALNALVVQFYKQSWDRMRGDEFRSQGLANFFYDFQTNSGGATKVLQRVMVQQFKQNISIDGAFGPATLAAVNACEPAALHNALKKARTAYVKALVDNNPDQRVFLPTWLKRINSFPDLEKKSPSPSPSPSAPPATGSTSTVKKLFANLRNPFSRNEKNTA